MCYGNTAVTLKAFASCHAGPVVAIVATVIAVFVVYRIWEWTR